MDANSLVSFETLQFRTHTSRTSFPYDVFIPCFDEPDYIAEELAPSAARLLNAAQVTCVYNGGSIKSTHAAIASLAKTSMVMVLDADLMLDRGPFNMFPTQIFGDELQYVHLWHVRNPINGLEYGHGGPKLFNREQLLRANDTKGADMTTAFGKGMVIHSECVGTHAFNWSAYSTWRTAYREAAKLTHLAYYPSSVDEKAEAVQRLGVWLKEADPEAPYSEFCINGANCGNMYAQTDHELSQLNDYAWLHSQFKSIFPNDD